MIEQYITLKSTTSTTHNFTKSFTSNPIQLDGDWEVAVAQIYIPRVSFLSQVSRMSRNVVTQGVTLAQRETADRKVKSQEDRRRRSLPVRVTLGPRSRSGPPRWEGEFTPATVR